MKAIVAADKNWGIGKDGKLLCHISGDLKYFKEKTMGKTVVMGRKTLESLPGGKPLPKRRNIVLTHNIDFKPAGAIVVNSIRDLFAILGDTGEGGTSDAQGQNIRAAESADPSLTGSDDVFVIGGAEIYSSLLDYLDTVFVTKIDKAFDADKFFPDLDVSKDFELSRESDNHLESGISYRFTEYKRVKRNR